MSEEAIEFTTARIKLTSGNLSAKNLRDEEITGNNNSTRLAVDAMVSATNISVASTEAANSLAGMIALNYARIAALASSVDAELASREAENQAQLTAQDINLKASAYADKLRLQAQSYTAMMNMKSHSITSYNQAVADGQNRITGIVATNTAAAIGLYNSYYEASGSQTSRRDLYHYSE